MSEYEKMAERLLDVREFINCGHGDVRDIPDALSVEAAAMIRKLAAENAAAMGTIAGLISTSERLEAEHTRLAAELDEARGKFDAMEIDFCDMREKFEAERSGKAKLVEALRPFEAFAKAFDRKPVKGLGDDLYSIHPFSEFEASIRLSDLRRARAAIEEVGR